MLWSLLSVALILRVPPVAALLTAPQRATFDANTSTKAVQTAKRISNWDLYATPTLKRPRMLIPKVLHQTYKGRLLPTKFQQYKDTWGQQLSANWTRMLWTEEDMRALVKEHYPWFLDTYDSYEQDINRIYAARIFFLHHYGGVYSDLDIEAIRDPTPLFAGDYDLVFFYSRAPRFRNPRIIDHPKGNAMGAITNAMMASVSKHPFWLFMAQKMLKAAKEAAALRERLYSTGGWGYKFKDVMWTTGSSLVTDTLAEYQEKFPDTFAGVFSNKYWAPWKSDARDITCEGAAACLELYPDAFVIHHWTGSWNHCTPGTCLPSPNETKKHAKKKLRMPPPPPLADAIEVVSTATGPSQFSAVPAATVTANRASPLSEVPAATVTAQRASSLSDPPASTGTAKPTSPMSEAPATTGSANKPLPMSEAPPQPEAIQVVTAPTGPPLLSEAAAHSDSPEAALSAEPDSTGAPDIS